MVLGVCVMWFDGGESYGTEWWIVVGWIAMNVGGSAVVYVT